MQYVETRPEAEGGLKVTDGQKRALGGWLTVEIEDGFSSLSALQRVWRDNLRQYDGVPKNPVRNTPVVNAPNIEVTIGAIACDSVYAQAAELIWATSPLLTIRAVGDTKDQAEAAQALQEFANHIVVSEIDLRSAYDNATLDDVQQGTGIYYIPWVYWTKKTSVHKITWSGPKVLCIPIEDFLVCPGSYSDLQQARWVAARFWMTMADLRERERLNGWDISGVAAAAAVDWVRQRRENLAHASEGIERKGDIYEILDVYCRYDIDEDGIPEDLYVAWDRTSSNVLAVSYNPYDWRPFEAMRYQQRAHLFYGLGVLEMIKPYQEEASELHNMRTLNTIIANTRLWKARTGSVPDNLRVWPNRVVTLDDPTSLVPEQMGDVYPSSTQAEAVTISLAERRVGVNDVSLPRPSQVLGSRTPGITALSLLQQTSKRFTHSFDNIRAATAGAVRQALYRYSERLLAHESGVAEHIIQLLGPERGERAIRLLSRANFKDEVTVELTASNAMVNREADRQNSVMLVNILAQYYQRTLELVSIASNPMTPPEVKTVAGRIANAVGNIIERTIESFDNVRDPQTFIVEVEDIIDNMEGLSGAGLTGLGQLLGLFAGQGPGASGAGAEMPGGGGVPVGAGVGAEG